MNILPKKSWHVLNFENKLRVKRDEAKAAEEEKEIARKAALAESEARTNLLRQRAKQKITDADEPSSSALVPFEGDRHPNFFKELDIKDQDEQKKNAEHEKEKEKEKDEWEKKMGILVTLGQSVVDAQHEKPWWSKTPEKRKSIPDEQFDAKRSKQEEMDRKTKKSLDPLDDMNRFVEKTKSGRHDDRQDRAKKKKKKHKHKSDKEREQKPASGKKTIDQLRAERLQRERSERQRAEELLAKVRGDVKVKEEPKVIMDDRERDYHSRFNPDFVKPRRRDRNAPLF